MFIEPRIDKSHRPAGWIEVICGSMFSGKTEELIRRLKRALIANQKIEIFKPALDTRYHAERVVSHNENAIRSTPIQFADEMLLKVGDCAVVGVDEAQFFDGRLVNVCNQLAAQGKRVIIAGLDMDFTGAPFGPMPAIMASAEYVTKVHAICLQCGAVAHFSHRLVPSEEKVMLGETEAYEPLCRKCYISSIGKLSQ